LTEPKTFITYKEKEELCRLITDLDPEDLPDLVKIIQSANPSYGNGASDDGEFEIDIERIDDMTLLEVKKYVEKCTQYNSRKKGRSSRNRKTLPEPVVDKDQMDLASVQTTNRLNAIKRQIYGLTTDLQ